MQFSTLGPVFKKGKNILKPAGSRKNVYLLLNAQVSYEQNDIKAISGDIRLIILYESAVTPDEHAFPGLKY